MRTAVQMYDISSTGIPSHLINVAKRITLKFHKHFVYFLYILQGNRGTIFTCKKRNQYSCCSNVNY